MWNWLRKKKDILIYDNAVQTEQLYLIGSKFG
jgi:hypothetical protein